MIGLPIPHQVNADVSSLLLSFLTSISNPNESVEHAASTNAMLN